MSGNGRSARSARLRVGLAGLGSMGQNHLRLVAGRSDARLVAVADPVEARRRAASSGTRAAAFETALQMIEETALDALIVAAPTTAHAEIVLAALGRDVAVLVEKPLAANVDEGVAIVQEAARRGVVVQVGHVERFNPAVLRLDQLLREGWLSTVYAVTSRRAGPFPARIRDVGVTIDLATHDVDILSWIVRERPQRVYAETARRIHATHEDLLYGLLHFPSGATGFLDVNWLTPTKRRQLHVVGEEGMFELDYLTQKLVFTRHPDVEHPNLIHGFAPTFAVHAIEVAVDQVEPLAAELDAFLTAVRTGGAPMVSGEDGLWALAMAEALLRSAAETRPVDVVDPIARRVAT